MVDFAADAAASRPVRGAWIEIRMFKGMEMDMESRPVRGAWIEILAMCWKMAITAVAPRKGRVD